MNPRSAIVLVVVALLVTSLGFAADGKVSTVKGQVVSVDTQTKMLTVQAEGPEKKDIPIQLAADTKILRGGKEIQVQEIGIGEKVTVNGKVVDGKWTAVTIGIEPSKG